MSNPTLVGYRGTLVSRDQIIPPLLNALAGIECTVIGCDAPSLNVQVRLPHGEEYVFDIDGVIAAFAQDVAHAADRKDTTYDMTKAREHAI